MTDTFYDRQYILMTDNIFDLIFVAFLVVMRIFMMSVETQSPLVMESITLSCLKILLKLVKPPAPTSKKNKVSSFHLQLHD